MYYNNIMLAEYCNILLWLYGTVLLEKSKRDCPTKKNTKFSYNKVTKIPIWVGTYKYVNNNITNL